MAKSYIFCNECDGVATIFLKVDGYYVIDCDVCGRHLQDISESEQLGGPARDLMGDEGNV